MSKIQHTVTPELGRYDFDGACAPHANPHFGSLTFSLGIFQWEAKRGYRVRQGIPIAPAGLKRSKAFRHVKGETGRPEPAYAEARRLCAGYNNGTLTPPLTHAND